MFYYLVCIVIGVAIGWAIPQPEWAKKLVDKAKSLISKGN